MNNYNYLSEYIKNLSLTPGQKQDFDRIGGYPSGYTNIMERMSALENTPGYIQYKKDPLTTDNKVQNFGREYAGLKIQLNDLTKPQKAQESEYQKILKKEFDRLKNERDNAKIFGWQDPQRQKEAIDNYDNKILNILDRLGGYENASFNRENLTAAQKAELEQSNIKNYYDFAAKYMAENNKNSLSQKDLLELQYKYDALAAKDTGGKQLSERTAAELGDITSNLNNWDYLKGLVEQNKKQFGFGMGNLRQSLPDMGWNTDAKTLSTKLKREAYDFWRSIDPRLSDQDAVRAIEQIGDLGNTSDYTLKQLDFLSKKAQEKAAARIKALELSGYRIPDEFKVFNNISNDSTSKNDISQNNKNTGSGWSF
jgi:hypothetical protein